VQASTFDAEGQMSTNTLGGTTTYVYDGEGQRVMKQTSAGTTTYVYDALGNLAAEYDSVATTSACGTPTCYVTVDQLGSTRVVTDSSGNVTQRYDYLPFGEEIPADGVVRTTGMGYQSSADGFNPKFTGQVRDVESGLDYFNARYYSPEQGRFVSADPQNAGSDPSNPQTWNGYAYVAGNPMAYTDPSGQGFWSTLGLDLLQGVIDLAPAIIGLVVPEVLPLPDIFLAADTTTAMDVPAFSITTIAAPTLGMVASEVGGLAASTALSAERIPGLTFYAQGTALKPRPEWLNDFTSIFGYDQNIPLPSCFGIAMKSTLNHLNPFTPDVAGTGEAVGNFYALSKYNQAIRYAASTPSRTFGTQFLMSPYRSSVFRNLMKASGRGALAGGLFSLDISLAEGLYDEIQAMKQGACQ
jgi:RHS repeat-associated protein